MQSNVVRALMRRNRYREAISEIKAGRGSPLSVINQQNLEYCRRMLRRADAESDKAHIEPSRLEVYEVGTFTIPDEARDQLCDLFSADWAKKISGQELQCLKVSDVRVFLVDSSPTALELYRKWGRYLSYDDIVIQLSTTEGMSDATGNTVSWLQNLGLNCYLYNVRDRSIEGYACHQRNHEHALPSISRDCAKRNSLEQRELYDHALRRISTIDLAFLQDEAVTREVRRNIARYKSIRPEELEEYSENVLSFPKDQCFLYLRNKYYNITGTTESDLDKVLDFFRHRQVHQNYYSEIIKAECDAFEQNAKAFLRGKKTVVFLDPTCYDQESGISSYLVNMYKFFKMSRLADQTLFLKNKFPSSEKENRRKFREYICDAFSELEEFSNDIVFFDSEAHYPGSGLHPKFRRICVVHCSSALAAKFDGKLPPVLSDGLLKIIRSEIENIRSAWKVITPTRYHDNIQKNFYREALGNFDDFTSDYLINYIHDEYIELIPFRERKYDLVFLGRPQKLKGFDVLYDIAVSSADIQIAIITNGNTEQTEELKGLPNVTLYLNVPKNKIYDVLRQSKVLLDLSPHHNCSTALLESLNAKTPAIVRDLATYHEMLADSHLEDLCQFVSEKEIRDIKGLRSRIIRHLNYLNSVVDDADIERKFNRFMLTRYRETYQYYSGLFLHLGFKPKWYRTSPVYNKFLKNKRIVNVVHSPVLSDGDGTFIDSFDHVVRFNRAIEGIVPGRHGSRTDILYSCLNRSPESGNMTKETYEQWIKPSGCWIAKAYPAMNWTGSFSFAQDHRAGATSDNYRFEAFNRDPLRTSEFSLMYYKLIEVNIKSRPNTGVLAILDLLQYDIESLYLKGYTFFKGGYDKAYRSQNEQEVMSYMANAGNHVQYRQNLFVRKILLTDPRVQFDESLREILDSM